MLTPKQAAARLGVSQSLIHAVLQKGSLPGLRIGCRGRGRWLIQEAEFEAWIGSCRISEPRPEEKLTYLKAR